MPMLFAESSQIAFKTAADIPGLHRISSLTVSPILAKAGLHSDGLILHDGMFKIASSGPKSNCYLPLDKQKILFNIFCSHLCTFRYITLNWLDHIPGIPSAMCISPYC